MKLVAFEIPDEIDESKVTLECDNTPITPLAQKDIITVGGIYSSEDYKIITQTEEDHMVFMVLRRHDV